MPSEITYKMGHFTLEGWKRNFTTFGKKIKKLLEFSLGKVPYLGKVEKCPYPESEGWKRKQYFLSASASCQKGPLLAEDI